MYFYCHYYYYCHYNYYSSSTTNVKCNCFKRLPPPRECGNRIPRPVRAVTLYLCPQCQRYAPAGRDGDDSGLNEISVRDKTLLNTPLANRSNATPWGGSKRGGFFGGAFGRGGNGIDDSSEDESAAAKGGRSGVVGGSRALHLLDDLSCRSEGNNGGGSGGGGESGGSGGVSGSGVTKRTNFNVSGGGTSCSSTELTKGGGLLSLATPYTPPVTIPALNPPSPISPTTCTSLPIGMRPPPVNVTSYSGGLTVRPTPVTPTSIVSVGRGAHFKPTGGIGSASTTVSLLPSKSPSQVPPNTTVCEARIVDSPRPEAPTMPTGSSPGQIGVLRISSL